MFYLKIHLNVINYTINSSKCNTAETNLIWQDKMNKNQTLEELSERVMTIEEAAEYLKIKKGTLQNWLSQEKFGFKKVKLASKTFVDRDQVEAFLSEALEA